MNARSARMTVSRCSLSHLQQDLDLDFKVEKKSELEGLLKMHLSMMTKSSSGEVSAEMEVAVLGNHNPRHRAWREFYPLANSMITMRSITTLNHRRELSMIFR